MPSLIPEILFAVAKKIVEDGDSDAVIRFALSGKVQLQAMKKVFATVTSLELFDDRYAVGFDNPRCAFNFKSNKPHLKFLMYFIGNYVTDLRINFCFGISHQAICQPIIDIIIAKKQLISFSISASHIYAAQSFIDEFLPQFSSTLIHVAIPSDLMTEKFRDTFTLDNLTITDTFGYHLYMFCCKTEAVTFSHKDFIFDRMIFKPQLSPALISIKQLVFDHKAFRFQRIEPMRCLPSIELIKFKVVLESGLYIPYYKSVYGTLIKRADKISPKVVLEFFKPNKNMVVPSLEFIKTNAEELEYDDSITDFYCFRKTVQSADWQPVNLEVHIPK